MEDEVSELLILLPKYEQIEKLLKYDDVADYIFKKAAKNLNQIIEINSVSDATETVECDYLVQSALDRFWENLYTGPFGKVSIETRQIYTIASFYKICYMLLESTATEQIEKCNTIMDEALLLGCGNNFQTFTAHLTAYIKKNLAITMDTDLQEIAPLKRKQYQCDIPELDCPSIEYFQTKYFETELPALLFNTIDHWPAMKKWRNLNYILKVAGNRTVPIEIGANYATNDWSQQLSKICDFLERQFAVNKNETTEIEYLAQHELFDQIQELKADICIPSYCALGKHEHNVDIKAWLGPKGTISPMHYDPKHNLLCQVFGAKEIILAAPTDTQYLYAHETDFLNNTSQIDAANLDYEKFPLTKNVNFLNLTLQEGDCLYIPPTWWHYVKAKSPSFSVSFWWD